MTPPDPHDQFYNEQEERREEDQIDRLERRIQELEEALGLALYHIDHEDASLSGAQLHHVLKARKAIIDVMNERRDRCLGKEIEQEVQSKTKELESENERLREASKHLVYAMGQIKSIDPSYLPRGDKLHYRDALYALRDGVKIVSSDEEGEVQND